MMIYNKKHKPYIGNYNSNNTHHNIILLVAIAFAIALTLRFFYFYPVIIQTNSMAPKIKKNSFGMFVKPRTFVVQKEKIVMVENPYSSVPFFCQIIATEGESIKIENTNIYINNNKVDRNFFFDEDLKKAAKNIQLPLRRDHYSNTYIRPDYFFCINHNWNNTYDSRKYGLFHKNSIQKELLFYNFLKI